MENIEETTVGSIGKWRIGIGNIWERRYLDNNGTSRLGTTAIAFLFNEGTGKESDETLGAGSVLELDEDGRWEVKTVESGKGSENGFVVLELIENPVTN